MSNTGKIISINISKRKGTIKYSIPEALINNQGIVGDAHSGAWHRQVSLLDQNNIDNFIKKTNELIKAGEFAENLTVSGINLDKTAILDRFLIGDIELELTQIGKLCHDNKCAVYRKVGNCVMPKKGIFCRVIHGGKIQTGDSIKYLPRTLKFLIITLSDRAFSKTYEDKSGPSAKQILEKFLTNKRWHWQIDTDLLPDDSQKLTKCLQNALKNETDIIFTLGGTGIGSRDIAPDIVNGICDKMIPGIMENIRMKYGIKNPNAFLSRGVAGIINKTQIYTLPGNVRAVEEYMQEILKTFEHIIFMLHGIDIH
ncbi:MAG: molybdenum cofactor synthesis protein [Coxiella sp. DG_40]|nr:MAG: molybdenum cofactor synthesis protein [Coxiella sp. DG_40]